MLDTICPLGESMKHLGKIVCGFLLASGGSLALEYTTDNKMVVPPDYREWIFLTASLDLNYNEPVPGVTAAHSMLDNIFVTPAAYKAFIATGKWPDKTVMIKENRRAESAGTLSKSGKFQAEVMSLEIHVKDEARFSQRWGFFMSSDGRAPAAFMPLTANCYSCHQDHAAVDTTFVQFYPTLFPIAKDKGVLSAAYLKAQK